MRSVHRSGPHGLEVDAEVIFIEPDSGDRPHLPDTYPDPYSIRHIGLEKYIEAYRVYPQERNDEIAAHAAGMAWKLQGADPLAHVFVVVSLNLLDPLLDAMEVPQDAPSRPKPPEIRLLESASGLPGRDHHRIPVSAGSLRELSAASMAPDELIDRPKVQFDLLREAEKEYVKNTGDKMEYWQRRMMARFTRNLASISGDLVAGVFDLTVAARSVVDDNYAYEVWQMANRYPSQKTVSDLLETVNLSGEEIWFNTKKLRLRRRLPRPKQRLVPRELNRAQEGKVRGRVGAADRRHRHLLLSARGSGDRRLWPFPEEKSQEHAVGESARRTEPFTTSILDGIDLRETIRNWHENKIYVQAAGPDRGRSGRDRRDFRRRSRRPLSISDHLAGRAPERIRHGVLFHAAVRSSGRSGDRARGIRRIPDDASAAPHDRRLVGR